MLKMMSLVRRVRGGTVPELENNCFRQFPGYRLRIQPVTVNTPESQDRDQTWQGKGCLFELSPLAAAVERMVRSCFFFDAWNQADIR